MKYRATACFDGRDIGPHEPTIETWQSDGRWYFSKASRHSINTFEVLEASPEELEQLRRWQRPADAAGALGY